MTNREENLQLYILLEKNHCCKWMRSVHGGRCEKTTIDPRKVEWALCCVLTLVSPTTMHWNPTPQGSWYLEILGSLGKCRGPNGGPLPNRISATERGLQREPEPSHHRGQSKGAWLETGRGPSLDRPGAGSLVLVSRPPQPWATHFCPCHLPSFWHVAMAACTDWDGSLAWLSMTIHPQIKSTSHQAGERALHPEKSSVTDSGNTQTDFIANLETDEIDSFLEQWNIPKLTKKKQKIWRLLYGVRRLAPNDEPFYPEGFPDESFKHSRGK